MLGVSARVLLLLVLSTPAVRARLESAAAPGKRVDLRPSPGWDFHDEWKADRRARPCDDDGVFLLGKE